MWGGRWDLAHVTVLTVSGQLHAFTTYITTRTHTPSRQECAAPPRRQRQAYIWSIHINLLHTVLQFTTHSTTYITTRTHTPSRQECAAAPQRQRRCSRWRPPLCFQRLAGTVVTVCSNVCSNVCSKCVHQDTLFGDVLCRLAGTAVTACSKVCSKCMYCNHWCVIIYVVDVCIVIIGV